MDRSDKNIPIFRDLLAKALGDYIIDHLLFSMTPEDILNLAESNTDALLQETQTVLDDESLDDTSCFQRIDAIVSAFHKQGLSTLRHDF